MKTSEHRKKTYQAWALKNRDRLLSREKTRQLTKRAQCLVSYARKRARDHGHAFDLDSHVSNLQARIDAGKCELTGIPFTLNSGRRWDSPSLDRIKPEDGYVIENMRVILHGMNAALGNWGEYTLMNMVSAMQSCRKSRRNSSKRRRSPDCANNRTEPPARKP